MAGARRLEQHAREAARLIGSREHRAKIENDARETINTLQQILGAGRQNVPTQGFETANRDFLKDVVKHAKKLKSTLTKPGSRVGVQILCTLFAPEESSLMARRDLPDAERMTAATIALDATAKRQRIFDQALDTLLVRCENLLSHRPLGEHGHFEYAPLRCAIAAKEFMTRWGRTPIYSSPKSPFAEITYEFCKAVGLQSTYMERVLREVSEPS